MFYVVSVLRYDGEEESFKFENRDNAVEYALELSRAMSSLYVDVQSSEGFEVAVFHGYECEKFCREVNYEN